jgi:hypothetical protein
MPTLRLLPSECCPKRKYCTLDPINPRDKQFLFKMLYGMTLALFGRSRCGCFLDKGMWNMIKCVMEDGRVRYFSTHSVCQIDVIEEGHMMLFYRRPNGEVATPRICEFMIVESGVPIT